MHATWLAHLNVSAGVIQLAPYGCCMILNPFFPPEEFVKSHQMPFGCDVGLSPSSWFWCHYGMRFDLPLPSVLKREVDFSEEHSICSHWCACGMGKDSRREVTANTSLCQWQFQMSLSLSIPLIVKRCHELARRSRESLPSSVATSSRIEGTQKQIETVVEPHDRPTCHLNMWLFGAKRMR